MPSETRRDLMRKMGAAGASIGGMSLAGCSEFLGADRDGNGGDGGESGNGDRQTEDDLPEERQITTRIVHLSNTERYYPERYQATVLADDELAERLGAPFETEPVEITVLLERERNGEFDLVTYNWESVKGGDPDNVIFDRFHAEGSRNYLGFDNAEYNEIAEQARTETDLEARQDLVYEAQQLLGEQRPENQYLYNEAINAYRSDQLDPDSIVEDGRLIASMYTWTEMEPLSEDAEVVVTNNWDPTNQLNPFDEGTLGPSRNLGPTRLMHDFLVRFDPSFERDLWVAEEIEWVDDTTVVASIRDGFEFHDGEPLTAGDVVWTYNTIRETEPAGFQTTVNTVLESAEQTGDSEVTFTLQDTFAPFTTYSMWEVPILPEHVWSEYLADTGSEETPWEVTIDDDRPIVGSGPFEYGSWDQAERFEMPANDGHPLAPPNIEMRVQRPLDTREAELAAIESGDYTFMDYWFGSPANLWELVEEEGNDIDGYRQPDNTRQATWVNTARPPFDDVAFRQAVNAVISDLQPTIIDEIYDGFGQQAQSPITNLVEFWHDPDTPWFEGGTDQAVEILNDAGYAWDEDGNLYYPEGKTGRSA